MPGPDFPADIAARAAAAGVAVPAELAARLGAYLRLLARWNRTINLAGFDLDTRSDAAIDRLIVEPLAAARYLAAAERRVIDVGSGGGSPALPLKIVRPDLEMVLVESKARKAAFLREAARSLDLADVEVENQRFEELERSPRLRGWADVITTRAVRMDAELIRVARALLVPGGRIFELLGPTQPAQTPGIEAVRLAPGLSGWLGIL